MLGLYPECLPYNVSGETLRYPSTLINQRDFRAFR